MPNPLPRPQPTINTDVQPRYYSTIHSASIVSASSYPSSSSDASAFLPPETAQWPHISLPVSMETTTHSGDDHGHLIATVSPSLVTSSKGGEVAHQRTGQMTQTQVNSVRALTHSHDHCLLVQPCTREAVKSLIFSQQLRLCVYHFESDSSSLGNDALLHELGAVTKTVESHKKLTESIRIFETCAMSNTANECNDAALQDIIMASTPLILGLNPLSSSAAPEKVAADHAND